MNNDTEHYQLWVNWDSHVASFQPVPGYDPVTFPTREGYQANVRLLEQSGYRFEGVRE